MNSQVPTTHPIYRVSKGIFSEVAEDFVVNLEGGKVG